MRLRDGIHLVAFWVVGVTSVATVPGTARAQASDPELRPTRGPVITYAARAGDADATATELNPGALALLPASSFDLVGAAAANGTIMPRRGWGLYWGAPLGFGNALGAQLASVTRDGATGIGGQTVFRLAYGVQLGRNAGLGISWAHVWDGIAGGADTFDTGLSTRFGRWGGLALTVEDFARPHPGGLPSALPRLWTAELVVRPLGTDRLEVAVGAAHAGGDLWKQFVPRARLSVAVFTGLRLYGEAQTAPTIGPAAATNTAGTLAFDANDTRVSVGLAADFGHARLYNAAHIFVPDSGSTDAGWAGRIDVSGQQRQSALASTYVARVGFDGLRDDRSFLQMVRRVRALGADPHVAAVLLKIEDVPLGVARIEEVRDLVAFLRAHGKRTFAYAPSPNTRSYYLASAADAVIIHPAGELALTGMAQQVTFYKSAMDRVGVHVDLVRIGEFKGAMEPFVMNEQSPAVRANHNQLLDDVFGRVVATIAADRTRAGHRMDAAEVKSLVDRALFTPGEAQLAGLIDAIADESALPEALGRALGRQGAVDIRDPDTAPLDRGMWPGRRVAVVLVDGTIVDGKSQELPFDLGSFAGADTLAEALEQCRRDRTVGAVVLRVNSPGGSAFASDVMARAIGRLRAAGKAVVVSMGDMAASGGYYISAPGDVIYAEPSTISGSIGVFGFKADVHQLMGTLGLSIESYKRGAHSDYQSPYRSWTDAELKIVMDKIRHIYALFLETVATGRKAQGLTVARVDEIGRGAVWTGALAQGLGLVDKMGGLADAIDDAARRGAVPLGPDQLPDLQVLPPSPSSALRRLVGLGASDDDAPSKLTAGLLGTEGRALLRMVASLALSDPADTGVVARLPYDIDIR